MVLVGKIINMKKIFLIIGLFLFLSCKFSGSKEYKYSGTVVDKAYEGPTSGYKSQTDPKYLILLKEDLSNQVIRINVTVPTWYSLERGQRTAFTLSNWDLYYSGNTTDMNKNLYGK
jgi:hypothetical protein